ncbi:MAG: hypothetical protein IK056_10575 [Clostridia bacterium]|nr:hypothetical protein [Clostridia bacterium]
MKTFSFTMTRSRWMSLLIAILCICMLVMLFSPYFTYGKDTTKLVPENAVDSKGKVTAQGDQDILYGRTWVLNGSDETQDGYKKIVVGTDGKNTSKVYSTNILRVNQQYAFQAFEECLANYNSIAQNVEDCEVLYKKAQDQYNEVSAYISDVITKVSGATGFNQEDVDADVKKLNTALNTCARQLDTAKAAYDTATENLAKAETALKNAYEAASVAYSEDEIDVHLPWVNETVEAYNREIMEVYPNDYVEGLATSKLDDFKVYLAGKYPETAAKVYAQNKTDDYKALLASKYADDYAKIKADNPGNDDKANLNALYKQKEADLDAETKQALYTELYTSGKAPEKRIYTAIYNEVMGGLKQEEKLELYNGFAAENYADPSDEDINLAVTEARNIIATRMSDEDRDEPIIGRLNEMKARSNKLADQAKQALNDTAAAIKAGEKKQTTDKSAKVADSIAKQESSAKEILAKYFPAPAAEAEEAPAEEAAAKEYDFTPIKRYDAKNDADFPVHIETREKEIASSPDAALLMETNATVKYAKGNSDAIGKVTITYANGTTQNTTFGTSVEYDGKKDVSIMGFVGFPEDLKDTFESEVAYQIFGYNRNTVVLAPIVLLILLVLGVVFAILKRDTFASGICPTAAGCLGVITYLASQFLKLGNYHTLHTIGFAVLFIVGALQLYFGIRDKLNKAKEA